MIEHPKIEKNSDFLKSNQENDEILAKKSRIGGVKLSETSELSERRLSDDSDISDDSDKIKKEKTPNNTPKNVEEHTVYTQQEKVYTQKTEFPIYTDYNPILYFSKVSDICDKIVIFLARDIMSYDELIDNLFPYMQKGETEERKQKYKFISQKMSYVRGEKGFGLIQEGIVEEKETVNGIKFFGLTAQGIKRVYKLIEDINKKQKEQDELEEEIAKNKDIEMTKKIREKAIIDRIYEYVDELETQLNTEIYTQSLSIVFNYMEFITTPLLEEAFLDNPQDVVNMLDKIICDKLKQHPMMDKNQKYEPKTRIINFPKSFKIGISAIRKVHIDKMITIEGTIVQRTSVNPKVTFIIFQCPFCGDFMKYVVPIDIDDFKEPTFCINCQRRGKMTKIKQECKDTQILKIEELGDELLGRNAPEAIHVILEDDLCKPSLQIYYNTGLKIKVTGFAKVYSTFKNKKDKIMVIEAHSIVPSQIVNNMNITDDDIISFKEFVACDTNQNILMNSCFPSIAHYDDIKKGMLCSVVGGVKSDAKRRDIHCLLVGEPSTGKSTMVEDLYRLVPNSRYASGTGTNDRGLGCAIIKDELTGSWSLSAGVLPLANNSIAFVDEIDKMEDTNVLHDALERQKINVNKANIKAELVSQTTLIASGNPTKEYFDSKIIPYEQIKLKKAIITRFDLIYILRDEAVSDRDVFEAKKMFDTYLNNGKEEETKSPDFIKKYLWYCRNRINPMISQETMKDIISTYQMMRSEFNRNVGTNVICSKRHFMTLTRLAIANAKLRLSDKVEKVDHDFAYSTLRKMLFDLNGNTMPIKIVSEEKLDIRDKVNLPCSVCGMSDDVKFNDSDGKPYCKECESAININKKKR